MALDRQAIEKNLQEENLGYLLITCSEPSSEGDMEVQMSYQGEKPLLFLLLEGAQVAIEEEDAETKIESVKLCKNGQSGN